MIVETFNSLSQYISAHTTESDRAAVPIPLVAEHLDVSSAAVSAMLKQGRLDGVKIGKSTLVTLDSLKRRETKRNDEVTVIYDYLLKLAKNGKSVIFYEPVMAQVDMTPRVPADRGRIGGILGKVSERSYAEDNVLLSVLVHQKKAGVTLPGKGFFHLAETLGLDWKDDPEGFVQEQTKKVLAAYRK